MFLVFISIVQQYNHSENDWSPIVLCMKLVPESGYAVADSHNVKTSWLEYVIWSYAFRNKNGNIRNIRLIQYNEKYKKSYCGLNCSQNTMGEAAWKLHERVIFRNTILPVRHYKVQLKSTHHLQIRI